MTAKTLGFDLPRTQGNALVNFKARNCFEQKYVMRYKERFQKDNVLKNV